MVPPISHIIKPAISTLIARLRVQFVENVTVNEQSNIRPDYNP